MASGTQSIETTAVVVGGGPAGMMTGYLLARAGIDVVVLEKHADFLRDFRGDTVHPSTLDVIDELGLLQDFLKLPHQEISSAGADIEGEKLRLADFTHLPTACKFVALTPQWHFLDFLAREGAKFSNFHLLMQTEGLDLRRDGERVIGVRAQGPAGPLEVTADLVIATDGRHSSMRAAAGFAVKELGAPIDVLWFRLNDDESTHHEVLGRISSGQILVMLDRGDYWQCALVIAKGSADRVKAQGIEAFRRRVAALAGRSSADEIASLDDVKLLTVKVDRLERWCAPGLIIIGDAAHAMSPVGGVGINLAIQDAVATANILSAPLRRRALDLDHLERVRRRRLFPTRATQALQITIQNRLIAPVLEGGGRLAVPWPLRLLQHLPILQRLPARIIGMGFRPEHVRADAASL